MPLDLEGKTYYSIPEVAAYMKVSKTSVQKYIETGALKARRVKVPTSKKPIWHSSAADIQEFYDRRKAKRKLREQVNNYGLCATSSSVTEKEPSSTSETSAV